MNQQVFNTIYAAAYDELYATKDYLAECDLLEALFQRHATDRISRILDLGCGTGAHAVPLASRGYKVTGVDRSEPMLRQALRKADATDMPTKPVFQVGDIRTIYLRQEFDAVIMMFAVLGYQITNDHVAATLRTVRHHLSKNGLFIFDVWHGPAVLVQRPADRVRVQTNGDCTIIRSASSSLHTNSHTCGIRFRVWRFSQNRLLEQTDETHHMRFFFPMELEYMLHSAGMSLLSLMAFPEADREPDESTWNVLGVARVTEM